MVASGDHQLHLPEEGLAVPVVVVAEGDVLDGGLAASREHVPDVGVEPGLVPHGEEVPLGPGGVGGVAEVGRHDDPLVLGEDETLHEGGAAARRRGGDCGALLLLLLGLRGSGGQGGHGRVAAGPAEVLHGRGLGVVGGVLDPYVRLAGDDTDGDAEHEGEGSVAPRDSVEEVGVLVVGGGPDDGAVGEAELELEAGLVEEALDVAGGLDAGAADQAAHGEVVHLGDDGEGVAQGEEGVRELAHGDQGLDDDDAPLGVHL